MNLESAFEGSYARVIGSGVGITAKGQDFFERFYDIFLSSNDEIQNKFSKTDMQKQVGVLQKGVFQLISFYLTKSDGEYIHSIALTHRRSEYDIQPIYYDLWLDALISTVKERDPDYEDRVGLAWRIVMTPGILYLKYHYDQ